MPVTLEGINSTPRSDTLNTVCEALFTPVATIGAGVANTALQASILLPYQYKIRKVSVIYSAIDAVAGLDSFNLVVGQTGAYTQNNPAPNDNSFDPNAATTVGINGLAQYLPPVLGGLGYPTNVAVVGQSVFTTDVPFGPAAGTYNAASPATQQGWITLTTTGGYGIFIPQNYDAVYPENIPLTLRVTTVVTTGSITALGIRLAITPMRKRVAPVGSNLYAALPGQDY